MSYLKKDGTWACQQTLKCNCPTASYDVLKKERRDAEKKLNYSAFKMWLELSQNIDGFEWKLSKAFFKEECGISENAYLDAKKELEKYGYIVWVDEKRTYGYFNRNGKPYSTSKPEETDAASEKDVAERDIPEEQGVAILDTPISEYDKLLQSGKKKKNSEGKWMTFGLWAKQVGMKYYDYYCGDAEKAKAEMIAEWNRH